MESEELKGLTQKELKDINGGLFFKVAGLMIAAYALSLATAKYVGFKDGEKACTCDCPEQQ